MPKKKTSKKSGKLAATKKQSKEGVVESEKPTNSTLKKENKQLIWFFVVIAIVFASFLIPYFLVQSIKSFEYDGIDWVYEKEVNYYHGRFVGVTNDKINYNIYIRTDPRRNNVTTQGIFDTFKPRGVISTTPEFDKCRGDASRSMRDLGAFLKTGLGLNYVYIGSTDKFVAVEEDRLYATCNNVIDMTAVIVDVGENNRVVQDENNHYCYIIYVNDCNDASAVEKFMLKTIVDSKAKIAAAEAIS